MKKNYEEHSNEEGLLGAVNRGYRRFWRRRGVDPKHAWKLEERAQARLPEDDEDPLEDYEQ